MDKKKKKAACEGCLYHVVLSGELEDSGLTGCRLGMEKELLKNVCCQTIIKVEVCHNRKEKTCRLK